MKIKNITDQELILSNHGIRIKPGEVAEIADDPDIANTPSLEIVEVSAEIKEESNEQV